MNKLFVRNLEPNITEETQEVGFLNIEQKAKLENIIGCKINNISFFTQAVTHRSYMHCVKKDVEIQSNERLEFLGDSILGMVTANYLYSRFSDINEGELTRLRSLYVNKIALAGAAKHFEIETYLLLSHAALKTINSGGDSIMADAMEAIIAAIFLDSGYENAKNFIINKLLPIIQGNENVVNSNFKSILLESVQAEGRPSPVYKVLEEVGPPHEKTFTVGVYVNDELVGTGSGRSKKLAEQDAAQEALKLQEF